MDSVLESRSVGELLTYRYSALSGVSNLVHAVTTRTGGVSQGPYGSLNLGLHVGDDPQAVITNRRYVSDALGLKLDSWVVADQVHGSNVVLVEETEKGRGAVSSEDAIPRTDALVTATAGVTLAVFSADCPLILIVDPAGTALAVVHAGWRSTVAGLPARTVKLMSERLDCDPATLLAVMSPSIGPQCYRVREDVLESTRSAPTRCDRFITRHEDHFLFDLASAGSTQLVEAGLRPGNVALAGLCNHCHAQQFYSCRLEKTTGRYALLASLR